MKPVEVFSPQDFSGHNVTPEWLATYCNQVLSERLLKKYVLSSSITDGDHWLYTNPNHMHVMSVIYCTEPQPIPKESVKVELEGNYESINWKPCEKFQGKRVKVTVEELP